MKTLRLLKLSCDKPNKYDNNKVKSNKVFLTVDNGLSHIFGPASIMSGSEWKVNADVQFHKQATISFFDEDLIRNLSTTKNFRNYLIKENEEVHKRTQTINFTAHNSIYILSFDII